MQLTAASDVHQAASDGAIFCPHILYKVSLQYCFSQRNVRMILHNYDAMISFVRRNGTFCCVKIAVHRYKYYAISSAFHCNIFKMRLLLCSFLAPASNLTIINMTWGSVNSNSLGDQKVLFCVLKCRSMKIFCYSKIV